MHKTGFITMGRDHLIQISTALAQALPLGTALPACYQDPHKPLIIAINGSLADGKKIFPDLVRYTLFGENFTLKGRYNYDEINSGYIDNIPHDISFLNLGWERGYSRDSLCTTRSDRKAIQYLHKDRRHPGISFIHNALPSIRRKADISLWLESAYQPLIGYNNKRRIKKQTLPIQQHFSDATCHNTWVRWCEININQRALLAHPPLRLLMESLSLAENQLSSGYSLRSLAHRLYSRFNQSAQDNVIPLYGHNLPRRLYNHPDSYNHPSSYSHNEQPPTHQPALP